MNYHCFDLITCGSRTWEVQGCYYGATGQESVIELVARDRTGPRYPVCQGGKGCISVPVEMLDRMIDLGAISVYRPVSLAKDEE